MPYVSESNSDPNVTVKVSRNGNVVNVSAPDGRIRSQYGYRSRSLTPAEERGIGVASSWGNVKSLIAFYEEAGRQEFGRGPDRAFVVNDRDYTEQANKRAEYDTSIVLKSPYGLESYKTHGCLSITGVTAVKPPLWPSDAVISSMAASQIRRIAPSQSEINLTRSLGELRDFPAMLKASNYRPSSFKSAGAAYLNVAFGINPTLSDVQKLAETVVSAAPILSAYVRQEKRRMRKSGRQELWSYSDSGELAVKVGHTTNEYWSTNGISMKLSYLMGTSPSGRSNVVAPVFQWSLTGRQEVRTSSTYEYFIPAPEGLDGRLSRAVKLARRLVGGGVDATTIYDLTPYSWLVDWFFDVGGLISYQQNCVDNQLVAIRKSFSIVETLDASVRMSGFNHVPGVVVGAYPLISASVSGGLNQTATLRHKKLRRRAGNPYSISPTWTDMSRQQWAILASMGLARGEGVAIKR